MISALRPLRLLLERLRARKEARYREVLDGLKSRYHIFRVLLASNEQALELINTTDAFLADRDASGALAAAEELLDVVFELVDGLNRLTDNSHAGLYSALDRMETAVNAITKNTALDLTAAPLCIGLDELGRDMARFAGGKASTLARLRRAGAPVPDGFVATTAACRRFLAATRLDETIRRRLREVESGGNVEAVTLSLQEAILAAPVPDDLARTLIDRRRRLAESGQAALSARSSALVEDKPEHSFAGQFSSVLNVTSDQALLEAFKRVVASNFGPRPTSYRRHAGLPLADFDMAVLCQVMVPARTAGVLFTMDPTAPESGRMLLSAVAGLGTQAVGGDSPADLYRPRREAWEDAQDGMPVNLARKAVREVAEQGGGLRREAVPQDEQERPTLSPAEVRALASWGRLIESLAGAPQDIEWAVAHDGRLNVLQARELRLPAQAGMLVEKARGRLLVGGGTCASSGRAVGRATPVRSLRELEMLEMEDAPAGPRILILSQSLPDAARILPRVDGVAVELGNPADHLSCVAREYGVPMITGAGEALRAVRDGQWIALDAGSGTLHEAPAGALAELEAGLERGRAGRPHPPAQALPPALARLRELVAPLNLTDAYGPTFSILECRSLHDIVRYVHEKAVLAMFETGDMVTEEAGGLLRRLDDAPFHFLVIDLGGGLAPGGRRTAGMRDVLSLPLKALCEGMAAPGLRWNAPPPVLGVSGLMGRAMLDGRGGRPVGSLNYALVTRDYLNLNARVDYHFAMVDAVCGSNRRDGYVRFRFKGGGTVQVQRERRARFIEEVLQTNGFVTDRRGDLVTGFLTDAAADKVREELMMLGRLIGFSRLLDAAMTSEDMPSRTARAFLEGDYGLQAPDLPWNAQA